MATFSLAGPGARAAARQKDATWPQAMLAARATVGKATGKDRSRRLADACSQIERSFPVQWDWMRQDHGLDVSKWFAADRAVKIEQAMVVRVLEELGPAGKTLRAELAALGGSDAGPNDPRWLDLYARACEQRRAQRLAPLLAKWKRIVFTKHFDMGGSHYAYAEGQSDAQAERHFRPGTSLCLIEMDGLYAKVRTLINDPKGVIRDPDVSYDGKRILFAWKKDDRKDDYHLYEMTVADGKVRQLTHGLGFADYECAYLPNGDIVFNSTRCVQIVDCWWTEVSNLYTCDRDGRYLRRLSFDQVHTNFPTVTPDGRVIYTRWDYNDRGQIYPQGLFQMYPDGTAQTELYGNNSWFPTTILHARAIPGTGKYVAIFTGHHARQKGWLALLDPMRGRQENAGAQLIAPVRETRAVHVDSYGQRGDQFQYPYPLSETAFIVTFKPEKGRFGIYFMTIDGERELLASDPRISCNQPVPLAPRPVPHVRPRLANYRKENGTVYLQDIYVGPGLEGIPRGTIQKLRVVALDFRAAGIGSNGNGGPAGGAMISTPVSIQGTWDVKRVLGTAKVHDDGSACFVVPARTPVYFQALDAKGHAVQTMRSWVTLQPGESVSCVGCHENKNSSPPVRPTSQALAAGPQKLAPPPWGVRGFSFRRDIQPILDKHCVRCHYKDTAPPQIAQRRSGRAFDPKKMRMLVPPEQPKWRYTFRKPYGNWTKPDYDDSSWKVGKAGFGTQGTPGAKVATRWSGKEIWLRRTFELKAAPASPGFLCHHDEDVEIYLNGDLAAQAAGYTVRYEVLPMSPQCGCKLEAGKTTIAVHCKQTGGGQYIDVAIIDTGEKPPAVASKTPAARPPVAVKPPPGVKPAFSLKGRPIADGRARRNWSDSYRALANRRVANWINVQSQPSMLPPYHAGAAKSKLIAMHEEGHNGVKLSREELDKIACWIDLLVPYCGDYTEANAWSDGDKKKYARYLAKRKRMEALERENIQALLTGALGPVAPKGRTKPPAYRNVALNPKDVAGKAVTYPHASSNSEYNKTSYAARCAIDGKTANRGHGGRFPSWGPHKRTDLWWKLEFGRAVEIDKIVLHIRAHFPHDRHWHSATIEFSDGSREKISIRKTHEPQTYTFKKRAVTWLKFTNLVQAEPLGWCGFSEVQVWGRDAPAP